MVTEEFEVTLEREPEGLAPRDHGHPSPWLWLAASCGLVAAGVVAVPEPDAAVGVVEEIVAPAQLWQAALPISAPDPDAPPAGPLAPSRRVAIIDGVAVVATDELIGGYSLDDGTTLWEIVASGRFCSLLSPLTCVVDDGARVLSIDVTSGEARQIQVSGAIAAAPLGRDLVVLLQSGGQVDAVRLARNGTQLWRTVLEERAPPAYAATDIAAVGDHVYVEGMGVLAAASGEPVDDAVMVVATAASGFRSGYHSATLELGNGTDIDLPGNALPLEVDDDPRSDHDVVLTTFGPAVVVASGKPVFATTGTPIARLAGRLVAVGGFATPTIIYDVTTGVATAELPTWLQCPCVGSGSVLVARPAFGFDGIVAVDVLAGAEVWSAPIELGQHPAVAMSDDGGLVLAGTELMFLRW